MATRLLAAVTAVAAAAPARSLATDAVRAATGERLYLTHCAPRHGKSGWSDAELFSARPRDLGAGFLGNYSTADLVHRVLDRRTLKLAFDLPSLKAHAKEVESLVAYLRRLPEINWRDPGRIP